MPILFIFTQIFNEAKYIVLAQPVTDYLATLLAAVLFVITYKKYFRHMK